MILEVEVGKAKRGGWVDAPSDPGGCTQWGISSRANPDLRDKIKRGILTREEAIARYYTRYYQPLGLPEDAPAWLTILLLDAVVHGGTVGLRDVTNLLQGAHREYFPSSRLERDGTWGKNTRAAVLSWRPEHRDRFLEALSVTTGMQAVLRATRSRLAQLRMGIPEQDFTPQFVERLVTVLASARNARA